VRGAQQETILDHCRWLGIWIVADDVYERYYFGGASAPSFLDISDDQDRLVSTTPFSKTWLMTGWRIGWLTAPAELMRDITKLIEFSTTCAPRAVVLRQRPRPHRRRRESPQ
jgi:aspartate/methionine/tyrosine aminotransferase